MAAIELTTATNVTKFGILTALDVQNNVTQVATNSANWIATRTSVFNVSGDWQSTKTSVNTTSANWSSVYSHVNATSGSKYTGSFSTGTPVTLTFSNGLLVSAV